MNRCPRCNTLWLQAESCVMCGWAGPTILGTDSPDVDMYDRRRRRMEPRFNEKSKRDIFLPEQLGGSRGQ